MIDITHEFICKVIQTFRIQEQYLVGKAEQLRLVD